MTIQSPFARRLLAVLVVVPLALALTGCPTEDDERDRRSEHKDPLAEYGVVVDAGDNGETIQLHVGDTLAVLRAQNATIPYDEILVSMPECLAFDGMGAMPRDTDEPIAEGEGYTAIWEFTATESGRGTVVIEMWDMDYTTDDPKTGERIIDPELEAEIRADVAARALEGDFDEADYFSRFTLEVVVEP
jgi:predicted secreted protein